MVYETIFPYLKGFHLTLAQHLPKRDEDGWKLADLEWIGHVENKVENGTYSREEADNLLSELNQYPYEVPSQAVSYTHLTLPTSAIV